MTPKIYNIFYIFFIARRQAVSKAAWLHIIFLFYKLQGRHRLNPSAAVETINPGI